MEGVLPFEYGYLYQVIGQGSNEEDTREISNLYQQHGVASIVGCGDYYGPRLNTSTSQYSCVFNPVGYDSKRQKVILESTLEEQDDFQNMVSFNYNQINNQNTFWKRSVRIYRVEVDVNVFIRNFEKVA